MIYPRFLLATAAVVSLSAPISGQSMLKVTKARFNNGLTVLLLEDHTVPTVAYHTLYKVGSRNERPGITGLSHLFEHMMFNGSAKYKPKELDRIIEGAGGGANAFTTQDTTQYMQEVSSAQVDKVIDIEADRMRALTISSQNLEQERAIVKEERRSSVDDQVTSSMVELLWNHAFVAHPYRWEVLGFMRDIDAITLSDAQDYFKTYYAPNNAVLAVVGDFKTADMLSKLRKAYSSIPAQKAPRQVVNAEPKQQGETRVVYQRAAELPSVLIGYKGVSIKSKDDAALDVLTGILASGQSSRLYHSLVYQKQVATDVSAGNDSRLDPGLFTFYAQAQAGHTAKECEDAIYEVIEDIKKNGVSDYEVQKAKNGLRAGHVSSFKTNAGIAELLASNEGAFGDWKRLYQLPKNRDAVTPADVKRVAQRYLRASSRTVVELRPEVKN